VYFYFEDGESNYTVGKKSHSWRGQLNDTQINMLAKRLRLRKREFEEFVSCAIEKGQFIQLWRKSRM